MDRQTHRYLRPTRLQLHLNPLIHASRPYNSCQAQPWLNKQLNFLDCQCYRTCYNRVRSLHISFSENILRCWKYRNILNIAMFVFVQPTRSAEISISVMISVMIEFDDAWSSVLLFSILVDGVRIDLVNSAKAGCLAYVWVCRVYAKWFHISTVKCLASMWICWIGWVDVSTSSISSIRTNFSARLKFDFT